MAAGIVGTPIRMNSSGLEAYIRTPEATTCPHARCRARRSGAVGRQVVCRTSSVSRTTTTVTTAIARGGLSVATRKASEPAATDWQMKSVAWVPNRPPAGTAKLSVRPSSPDQVNGSVHCVFVFGPVGPL